MLRGDAIHTPRAPHHYNNKMYVLSYLYAQEHGATSTKKQAPYTAYNMDSLSHENEPTLAAALTWTAEILREWQRYQACERGIR